MDRDGLWRPAPRRAADLVDVTRRRTGLLPDQEASRARCGSTRCNRTRRRGPLEHPAGRRSSSASWAATGHLAGVVDVMHVRGMRDDSRQRSQILAISGLPPRPGWCSGAADRRRRVGSWRQSGCGRWRRASRAAAVRKRWRLHVRAPVAVYQAVRRSVGASPQWSRAKRDAARLSRCAAPTQAGSARVEIADAGSPFTPRGCPFQAWSLGELIRLDRVVLAEPRAEPARGKMEAAWA